VFWLAWWATCFSLWVLLVFKTEPAELVAGAVAGALAATGAELVRSRGYAPFAARAVWLRALVHVPGEVAADSWRMARVLVRHFLRGEPVEGCFRVVEFPIEPREDPRSHARRVVVQWLGCVSPNTYVVGLDEQHQVALVHQLVRDELPPELKPEQ
jgi:multisubunit Na+/H+ antiporter MnhE subunit